MKNFVDVSTGQLKVTTDDVILRSIAIGSCVVIVAYDSKQNMGALAHVMLPGRAPTGKSSTGKIVEKTRYAADAIDELIKQMRAAGSELVDIETVLVGGGNILQKKDDTVCQNNIQSTISLLEQKNIPIKAAVLGGTRRKGVFLDVASGCVSYTEGDEGEKLLWQAHLAMVLA